ncbi:MAG: radical SAM protein, partial [Acutalibacteraceae bacterium]|nr:radical SAM protein [Acutalibacteraceae bacterium]
MHKGFNYSQDGPGNRLVYHLQGCNLHCLWCSNPESMKTVKYGGISVEDMAKQIVAAEPMFFDGGGVTFTGGEPTLQFEALKKLLVILKEKGISTAIETNGTNPRLPELFELIDFLIMDFKHYDGELLKKYTGLDGSIIKENYKKIAESGRQCHIRIPLI